MVVIVAHEGIQRVSNRMLSTESQGAGSSTRFYFLLGTWWYHLRGVYIVRDVQVLLGFGSCEPGVLYKHPIQAKLGALNGCN